MSLTLCLDKYRILATTNLNQKSERIARDMMCLSGNQCNCAVVLLLLPLHPLLLHLSKLSHFLLHPKIWQWGCVLSSIMAILHSLVLLLISSLLFVSWLSSLSLPFSSSRCFLSLLYHAIFSILIISFRHFIEHLVNNIFQPFFSYNWGSFEYWDS